MSREARRDAGQKWQELIERALREAPDAENETKLGRGYSRSLSIEQAFSFNRSRQESFGYITSLSIGSGVVQPDYVLDDPIGGLPAAPSATQSRQARPGLKVVGVLSEVSWELGVEDPITFSARISAVSKNAIMGVQYSSLPSVDVAVSWVVYEYDQAAFQYYVAFGSSTGGSGGRGVRGQIVKSVYDRALELRVGFEPASEVYAPQNFELEFTMRPVTGTPQVLYLGTSRLGRIFKTWGQAAAPSR